MAEGNTGLNVPGLNVQRPGFTPQKLLFLPPVHEASCAGINPFGGRGNFSEALLNSEGAKRQRHKFGVQVHFICAIIAFKYVLSSGPSLQLLVPCVPPQ